MMLPAASLSIRTGQPHAQHWAVRIVTLALTLIIVTLLGCDRPSATDTNTAPPSAPRIVATTGMIADLARQIACDRAHVTALMGEGVDPHLYKASPGDFRLMSDADLLLYNGLHLEGRLADAIVKLAKRVKVVRVTEGLEDAQLLEPPAFDGHYDPHVWFDVSLWSSTLATVSQALIEIDPAGRDAYTANLASTTATLIELHDYAKSTLATIPPAQRVMITAHDAFGYFGRAYGLEVLAIQGLSTESEASLKDLNRLVDTLVERKIPAVFIESSVPRKTIDALVEGAASRGHRVAVGGELFSDAMGPADAPEGTYVGMIVHNVEVITKALGGTVPLARPAQIASALTTATNTSKPPPNSAVNAPSNTHATPAEAPR
jgi:manganese/zinc/iron transport system substrate-binding protein